MNNDWKNLPRKDNAYILNEVSKLIKVYEDFIQDYYEKFIKENPDLYTNDRTMSTIALSAASNFHARMLGIHTHENNWRTRIPEFIETCEKIIPEIREYQKNFKVQ